MDKDLAIKNIKETLKRLMFSGKKMDKLKLTDGTELAVEAGSDVAVGTPIFTIDSDGNQKPCEDGTYELEDGRTLTVAKGQIESIADASSDPKDKAEDSPASDAKTTPDDKETMAIDPNAAAPSGDDDAEQDADLASRVSALEEQISQILEILQGMSNMNEQTMNKINEFAASPAEESIKQKKVVATTLDKMASTKLKFRSEMDELKSLMKKSGDNYGSFNVSN